VEDKKLILAVDDSKMNHRMIERMLGERYLMTSAYSGKECLSLVEEKTPDLILLDVTMPDMDGYETCLALRKRIATSDVPILFLSGRCSVEEKLKGYEVGGDDYLTKPFDDNEVLVKIEKNLAFRDDREQLKRKAESASNIAFHALNEKSNIGVCLRFLEGTHLCEDDVKIAELICGAASALGIQVNVQMRVGDEPINYSVTGNVPDLESALLEKAKDKGRFVPFGRRLIVNEEDFSMLARNMPEGDEKRYEMLKQHMYTILRGGYTRHRILAAQKQIQSHRDTLSDIVTNTHTLLKSTDQTFVEIMRQSAVIVEEMVQELEAHVIHDAGLSEALEHRVIEISERCVTRINKLHSQMLQVDNNFSRLVVALQQAHQDTSGLH